MTNQKANYEEEKTIPKLTLQMEELINKLGFSFDNIDEKVCDVKHLISKLNVTQLNEKTELES